MPNTITLKGESLREEGKAAEAGIYPGMLVELDSDGNVLKQTADGGVCEKAVAVEDALQGNTIETVYTNGARVQYEIYAPGAVAYIRIANGEAITKKTKLVSNGDGTFRAMGAVTASASAEAADQVPEYPLAVALEDLDMSGSSAVDPDPFCKARFL